MALDETEIAHLLRRTEFKSSDSKLSALINLSSREAAVDAILARNMGNQTHWPAGAPFFFDALTTDGSWRYTHDFRRWWIDEMAFGSAPLREKMALFWHGHFTSSTDVTSYIQHAFAQNQLYRDRAFGNFKDLAQTMSIEPLMLLYLNNHESSKWSLNENFGRELLELFVLGLNSYGLLPANTPTYTQTDVLSCAKAWTGHGLEWEPPTIPQVPRYIYRSNWHVTDSLSFLGSSSTLTGPQTIDKIFATNPFREISCRFIATKLWSHLAYTSPETAVIDNIIATYKNTLQISDLLRAILVHPNFYSEKARMSLVSTPAEYVARLFALSGVRMTDDISSWTVWTMPDASQELLNPPNVAGWKANNYWLSTSALGARGRIAEWVFYSNACKTKFADLETASVSEAVRIALRRMGLVSVLPNTKSVLETWLTRERSRSGSYVSFRSSGLFHMIIMSPDFQLS